MIVNNLDIMRAVSPAKTHAILVIDAHAPLTLTRSRALQRFQSIAWRRPHVINTSRQVQLLEFAKRRPLEIREARHSTQLEQGLGIGTLKRQNRHR